MGLSNGGQSSIEYRHGAIPCTNLVEQDVVFGGTEKLEGVIRRSLEYYKKDLVLVISGCASGLIGDDIDSVISEFADADTPVIHAEAPGFKGSNLYGHEQVLLAIINQYLPEGGNPREGLVNIFGVVPAYDAYWMSGLDEIERILRAVGLEPNIIYGNRNGKERLDDIPNAAFNLVIGPWVDLNVVQRLEEKYGTPYLHYPAYPIGPTETTRFLHTLAEYAKLDKERVEAFIKASEDEYYYYVARNLQWMYYGKNIPRKFVIIAQSAYTLGLAKYLINDIGFVPRGLYAVDVPSDKEAVASIFKEELADLDGGIQTEIVIEDDPGAIEERIHREKAQELLGSGISYLFGSSWDGDLAADTNSFLLPVSAPNGTIVVTRHFFGYRGGLNLLEYIFNTIPNLG
jgi:nitrogenase molybdenum-iron protein beta chain